MFVLLHIHAYRRREQLQLNTLEVFDTISGIQESALNCGIALVSISIVWFGGAGFAGFAGMTYMLTGLVMATHGFINGARRKRIEKEFANQFSKPVYEPELQG